MLGEFNSFVVLDKLKALQHFLDILLGWQDYILKVIFKVAIDISKLNIMLASIKADIDTTIGGMKEIYPPGTQARNFHEFGRYSRCG